MRDPVILFDRPVHPGRPEVQRHEQNNRSAYCWNRSICCVKQPTRDTMRTPEECTEFSLPASRLTHPGGGRQTNTPKAIVGEPPTSIGGAMLGPGRSQIPPPTDVGGSPFARRGCRSKGLARRTTSITIKQVESLATYFPFGRDPVPINAVCPECQNRFQLQEGMLGKSMGCPNCQEVFIVKDAGPVPAHRRRPAPRLHRRPSLLRSAMRHARGPTLRRSFRKAAMSRTSCKSSKT